MIFFVLFLAVSIFHSVIADSAELYSNPLLSDIRDPEVVCSQGKYYVHYPDKISSGGAYMISESDDLVNWSEPDVIFKNQKNLLPGSMYVSADGKYYLYYVVHGGRNAKVKKRSIGVAIASDIKGPYQDIGLLLDSDVLDSDVEYLDPFFYRDDDGKMYLIYKETIEYGTYSKVMLQEMKDPITVNKDTPSKELIRSDRPWERRVVEHPYILKHKNLYYLFYSGGRGDDDSYNLGFATGNSIKGSFVKSINNPLIKGSYKRDVISPGAFSFVKDSKGEIWALYRQKASREIGWDDRFLALDSIKIDDGEVLFYPTKKVERMMPVLGKPHKCY